MNLWKALEKQEETDLRDAGITDRLDDHLYMYHMPYSYTAEQIRKLRTAIFHMPDVEPPRVIMITSALPSEGKSLIASNLSIAIALGEDSHVLLVECDIRKPSLHGLFKYPPSKGVAEILQGRATVAECLIKTPIDKLSILPAAKEAPVNPSELLESRGMKSLIRELSERYSDRFLVIDTSPIQATVDPKILASQVDAIVMVARYRYTRESDFKMALENLPKDKVIGTVLNATDELPAKKYSYNKYQYNKYYS
jgi:protein-tyrosine kinase